MSFDSWRGERLDFLSALLAQEWGKPIEGAVSQTAGIVVSLSDLTYDIWTDGACANKTSGAGGYAAVLFARRSDGSIAEQWEVSGGAFETTNNRMELMAVIAGLRALPAPARVCVHIDSTYVMKNFKERLERWQGNGWRTADRKPVKNRDLWEELSTEVARRKVEWVKVAGHTGDELNERADNSPAPKRTPTPSGVVASWSSERFYCPRASTKPAIPMRPTTAALTPLKTRQVFSQREAPLLWRRRRAGLCIDHPLHDDR